MTSKFDSLLEQLGTGRWNFLCMCLLSYWVLHVPPQEIGGSFLVPFVPHSCRIPQGGQPIYVLGEDNVTKIDECWYLQDADNESQKLPCTEWDFDNSTFSSTITSEFQLVCQKDYLRPTFKSVYFFGSLIAAPLDGFLCDRFGRKKVISFGIVCYTVVVNIFSWLPDMSSILVARFIIGFMNPTSVAMTYALAMEQITPSRRSIVGILGFLPLVLGIFNWAGQGYLIRDWRWLMFSVGIPPILTFILLWFVDESPRWLIIKGRHDQALQVLKRVALLNKSKLPPDEEILPLMKEIQAEQIKIRRHENKGSSRLLRIILAIWDETAVLFRTREMRRITLSLYFAFFVAGMVYVGLSLGGDNLGSDPYIYMALVGAMELPAKIAGVPLVNILGRTKSTTYCFSITGVSLILVTVIPKGWMITAMALVGKMGITAGYLYVYMHATELFPTEVRTRGLGSSVMVSKLGAMIIPYIFDILGPLYWWAPSVLCGVFAIAACPICFMLPETKGEPLPDTVAALEMIAEKKRITNAEIRNSSLSEIQSDKI